MMDVLAAGDFRRMRWKNGGGETIEVAVGPTGAGLDQFDWRVSMAKVASDGPFSIFPGIDRTLAVLSGAGLVLGLPDRAPITLMTTAPPLSFPADIAVSATLVDGPIIDLNVMTRRAGWSHRLTRLELTMPTRQPLRASISLALADRAVAIAGQSVPAGDAWRYDTDVATEVTITPSEGRTLVHLIEIWSTHS